MRKNLKSSADKSLQYASTDGVKTSEVIITKKKHVQVRYRDFLSKGTNGNTEAYLFERTMVVTYPTT